MESRRWRVISFLGYFVISRGVGSIRLFAIRLKDSGPSTEVAGATLAVGSLWAGKGSRGKGKGTLNFKIPSYCRSFLLLEKEKPAQTDEVTSGGLGY